MPSLGVVLCRTFKDSRDQFEHAERIPDFMRQHCRHFGESLHALHGVALRSDLSLQRDIAQKQDGVTGSVGGDQRSTTNRGFDVLPTIADTEDSLRFVSIASV